MNRFVRMMVGRGYWDEVPGSEAAGGGSDGGWTPPESFSKEEAALVEKGLDEMSPEFFGLEKEDEKAPESSENPGSGEEPEVQVTEDKPEDKKEEVQDPRTEEERAQDETRAHKGTGDINVIPKAWKAGLAADYAALPENIKAEIHRREENFYNGFEQMRPAVDFAVSMDEAIRPFAGILQEQKATPQKAVEYLFSMYSVITKGTQEQRVQAFNHLLNEAKLPASALSGFDAEAQPYVDPAVEALRGEVNSLKSERETERQQQLAQLKQQAEREFDAFAKANPLVEKCMDDMLPYLRAGLTLQQAFDKAKFANPVVRTELQKAEADAKKAEEDKKNAEKAQRSRQASKTAVKDNSRRGGPTAPLGSIDDTMKEVLANIQARS